MTELADAQIDAALEHGRTTRRYEPRAAAARYDPQSGRVTVELANGCTFAFPPKLAQRLGRRIADRPYESERRASRLSVATWRKKS